MEYCDDDDDDVDDDDDDDDDDGNVSFCSVESNVCPRLQKPFVPFGNICFPLLLLSSRVLICGFDRDLYLTFISMMLMILITMTMLTMEMLMPMLIPMLMPI